MRATLSTLAIAAFLLLGGCGDDPPPMNHGQPNEAAAQMCVVCHTCDHDGSAIKPAPVIDRTHGVCNSCHEPDGSVIHHSGDGCEWNMDCEATPPIVNCNDCHTVEHVNDLCRECH